MYYFIRGEIAYKDSGIVVIDCNNVGYQINVSTNTLSILGAVGDVATVFTYLYLREGVMDLYGFATEEEKSMFIHLISISGIGPKAGLAILSVAPPEQLALAIITGNTKLIQKAQGVGIKAASRVILELKDKLKTEDATTLDLNDNTTDNRNDALSALIVLGYSQNEAKSALSTIDGSADTESIIKQALKKMM